MTFSKLKVKQVSGGQELKGHVVTFRSVFLKLLNEQKILIPGAYPIWIDMRYIV